MAKPILMNRWVSSKKMKLSERPLVADNNRSIRDDRITILPSSSSSIEAESAEKWRQTMETPAFVNGTPMDRNTPDAFMLPSVKSTGDICSQQPLNIHTGQMADLPYYLTNRPVQQNRQNLLLSPSSLINKRMEQVWATTSMISPHDSSMAAEQPTSQGQDSGRRVCPSAGDVRPSVTTCRQRQKKPKISEKQPETDASGRYSLASLAYVASTCIAVESQQQPRNGNSSSRTTPYVRTHPPISSAAVMTTTTTGTVTFTAPPATTVCATKPPSGGGAKGGRYERAPDPVLVWQAGEHDYRSIVRRIDATTRKLSRTPTAEVTVVDSGVVRLPSSTAVANPPAYRYHQSYAGMKAQTVTTAATTSSLAGLANLPDYERRDERKKTATTTEPPNTKVASDKGSADKRPIERKRTMDSTQQSRNESGLRKKEQKEKEVELFKQQLRLKQGRKETDAANPPQVKLVVNLNRTPTPGKALDATANKSKEKQQPSRPFSLNETLQWRQKAQVELKRSQGGEKTSVKGGQVPNKGLTLLKVSDVGQLQPPQVQEKLPAGKAVPSTAAQNQSQKQKKDKEKQTHPEQQQRRKEAEPPYPQLQQQTPTSVTKQLREQPLAVEHHSQQRQLTATEQLQQQAAQQQLDLLRLQQTHQKVSTTYHPPKGQLPPPTTSETQHQPPPPKQSKQSAQRTPLPPPTTLMPNTMSQQQYQLYEHELAMKNRAAYRQWYVDPAKLCVSSGLKHQSTPLHHRQTPAFAQDAVTEREQVQWQQFGPTATLVQIRQPSPAERNLLDDDQLQTLRQQISLYRQSKLLLQHQTEQQRIADEQKERAECQMAEWRKRQEQQMRDQALFDQWRQTTIAEQQRQRLWALQHQAQQHQQQQQQQQQQQHQSPFYEHLQQIYLEKSKQDCGPAYAPDYNRGYQRGWQLLQQPPSQVQQDYGRNANLEQLPPVLYQPRMSCSKAPLVSPAQHELKSPANNTALQLQQPCIEQTAERKRKASFDETAGCSKKERSLVLSALDKISSDSTDSTPNSDLMSLDAFSQYFTSLPLSTSFAQTRTTSSLTSDSQPIRDIRESTDSDKCASDIRVEHTSNDTADRKTADKSGDIEEIPQTALCHYDSDSNNKSSEDRPAVSEVEISQTVPANPPEGEGAMNDVVESEIQASETPPTSSVEVTNLTADPQQTSTTPVEQSEVESKKADSPDVEDDSSPKTSVSVATATDDPEAEPATDYVSPASREIAIQTDAVDGIDGAPVATSSSSATSSDVDQPINYSLFLERFCTPISNPPSPDICTAVDGDHLSQEQEQQTDDWPALLHATSADWIRGEKMAAADDTNFDCQTPPLLAISTESTQPASDSPTSIPANLIRNEKMANANDANIGSEISNAAPLEENTESTEAVVNSPTSEVSTRIETVTDDEGKKVDAPSAVPLETTPKTTEAVLDSTTSAGCIQAENPPETENKDDANTPSPAPLTIADTMELNEVLESVVNDIAPTGLSDIIDECLSSHPDYKEELVNEDDEMMPQEEEQTLYLDETANLETKPAIEAKISPILCVDSKDPALAASLNSSKTESIFTTGDGEPDRSSFRDSSIESGSPELGFSRHQSRSPTCEPPKPAIVRTDKSRLILQDILANLAALTAQEHSYVKSPDQAPVDPPQSRIETQEEEVKCLSEDDEESSVLATLSGRQAKRACSGVLCDITVEFRTRKGLLTPVVIERVKLPRQSSEKRKRKFCKANFIR